MPRTRQATDQGDLSALLPAFDRDPIYKPRKPRAKTVPPAMSREGSPTPANQQENNPTPAANPQHEPEVDEGMKQFGTLIANSFAEALRNVGSSDSAVKHRTPDTFSGTDPYKLRSFLAQCELYFRANSKKFPNDEKKVLFAFTYLSDVALEWFEQKFANAQHSFIPDSASQGRDEEDEEEAAEYITTLGQVRARRYRENEWVTSWEAFVYEISIHFGPADDEGDAERQLNNLTMPSDKRIIWYNIRFNRYSARTGWDDRALCYRYYNGLPDRLQDAITSDGKPRRLSEMKKLALKWDQRYWERQGERRKQSDKDKKPQKPANTTSSSTSANTSSSPQSASASNNNNRAKNPAPKHNSSNSASSASGNKNSLSDKLGSDGKLTPAERARRLANNLCLFCGNAGHRASECRKAMKARAAKPETPKADAAKANSDNTSGKP